MSSDQELYDEIDKNDLPTGRKITRQQAHGQKLIHRVVAVFVFAADGRLYIQERKGEGIYDHSVGGHVDSGEDYQTAAYRETAEELGLEGVHLSVVELSILSDGRDFSHMHGLFTCQAPPDWTFVPNDEVEHIFLWTIEELVNHINTDATHFTRGFINTTKAYIRHCSLPYKITV